MNESEDVNRREGAKKNDANNSETRKQPESAKIPTDEKCRSLLSMCTVVKTALIKQANDLQRLLNEPTPIYALYDANMVV